MTAYIFDTETSDRNNPEIIEAALMRMPVMRDLAGDSDEINIAGPFECAPAMRFKPEGPMTTGAIAVHGILPYELENCPPSKEFALPLDCEYVVGHSIDFDWKAAGSPGNVKRICTHAIAQWLWPNATGYSLVALMYETRGLTPATRAFVRGAHSASHDCLMALHLLGDILKRKPDITTWSKLWEYSEECRIPRTCPMKKYEGVLLEDLDEGFVYWCLEQPWLDPYFRKGLDRMIEKRYQRSTGGILGETEDTEEVADL